MKRVLGLVLCVVLFVVCLSGCTAKDGSVTPTDTPQSMTTTEAPTDAPSVTDQPTATDAPASTDMPDTTDSAVTTAPTGENSAR